MAFTYLACPNCRKINRASLDQAQSRQAVCGSCKTPLPLHGAISELNASTLMALVEKCPISVVAYFWAPWCAPCRSFGPIFERAAQSLVYSAVFTKIDMQANPLASDTYGIRAVPTLIFFHGGFERARQPGALPLELLERWVRENVQLAAASKSAA